MCWQRMGEKAAAMMDMTVSVLDVESMLVLVHSRCCHLSLVPHHLIVRLVCPLVVMIEKLMSFRSILTPVCVMAVQQRFAGHAKWQNIAHTKAANDMKKGKLVSKYCLQIRKTMQNGASTDPKVNDALRNVVASALKMGVPRVTIDRQIERAKNVTLRKMLLEVYGPGRSFILLDIETDNISRTRHDIKKILRKVKG